MERDKVKKLILEDGLTLTDVIDAVIKLNGFVGVGLISLAEDTAKYIKAKLKKETM